MSFQLITQVYQDQLDEFKNSPLTEENMEEIKDILFDYCFDVEQRYGVSMSFEVWVGEDGSGLKYKVSPDSDLDAVLLKHVVENAESVGVASSSFH